MIQSDDQLANLFVGWWHFPPLGVESNIFLFHSNFLIIFVSVIPYLRCILEKVLRVSYDHFISFHSPLFMDLCFSLKHIQINRGLHHLSNEQKGPWLFRVYGG